MPALLFAAVLLFLSLFAAMAGAVSSLKAKLLDTVTSISASEDDVTVYDTRGMTNITFRVLATANTGFGTGSDFFVCTILGCDTETGTFTPLAGLTTAELVINVGQQIAASTAFPVLPRFIKVRWTETGTITVFTATCRMHYDMDPMGPGKQYQSGYTSG